MRRRVELHGSEPLGAVPLGLTFFPLAKQPRGRVAREWLGWDKRDSRVLGSVVGVLKAAAFEGAAELGKSGGKPMQLPSWDRTGEPSAAGQARGRRASGTGRAAREAG